MEEVLEALRYQGNKILSTSDGTYLVPYPIEFNPELIGAIADYVFEDLNERKEVLTGFVLALRYTIVIHFHEFDENIFELFINILLRLTEEIKTGKAFDLIYKIYQELGIRLNEIPDPFLYYIAKDEVPNLAIKPLIVDAFAKKLPPQFISDNADPIIHAIDECLEDVNLHHKLAYIEVLGHTHADENALAENSELIERIYHFICNAAFERAIPLDLIQKSMYKFTKNYPKISSSNHSAYYTLVDNLEQVEPKKRVDYLKQLILVIPFMNFEAISKTAKYILNISKQYYEEEHKILQFYKDFGQIDQFYINAGMAHSLISEADRLIDEEEWMIIAAHYLSEVCFLQKTATETVASRVFAKIISNIDKYEGSEALWSMTMYHLFNFLSMKRTRISNTVIPYLVNYIQIDQAAHWSLKALKHCYDCDRMEPRIILSHLHQIISSTPPIYASNLFGLIRDTAREINFDECDDDSEEDENEMNYLRKGIAPFIMSSETPMEIRCALLCAATYMKLSLEAFMNTVPKAIDLGNIAIAAGYVKGVNFVCEFIYEALDKSREFELPEGMLESIVPLFASEVDIARGSESILAIDQDNACVNATLLMSLIVERIQPLPDEFTVPFELYNGLLMSNDIYFERRAIRSVSMSLDIYKEDKLISFAKDAIDVTLKSKSLEVLNSFCTLLRKMSDAYVENNITDSEGYNEIHSLIMKLIGAVLCGNLKALNGSPITECTRKLKIWRLIANEFRMHDAALFPVAMELLPHVSFRTLPQLAKSISVAIAEGLLDVGECQRIFDVSVEEINSKRYNVKKDLTPFIDLAMDARNAADGNVDTPKLLEMLLQMWGNTEGESDDAVLPATLQILAGEEGAFDIEDNIFVVEEMLRAVAATSFRNLDYGDILNAVVHLHVAHKVHYPLHSAIAACLASIAGKSEHKLKRLGEIDMETIIQCLRDIKEEFPNDISSVLNLMDAHRKRKAARLRELLEM